MKIALRGEGGAIEVAEVVSIEEADKQYGDRVLGYVIHKTSSVGMSTVMNDAMWEVSEADALRAAQERWG